MIQWESPAAFLLFIPLAVLVFYKIFVQKGDAPFLKFSKNHVFKKKPMSLRAKLKSLPFLLKLLSISLAIFALARPQKADVKVKRNVEGIDIVVALDISDSMLIEDMKPENRLEASKLTIKRFIEKRISDRIGLVVFSGESYTRVPLTLDYPLLQESLKEVTTTRNIKVGTAIGVALSNAVGRLKESTAKSRVVIFLTDGENNSGTIAPETAIEIAKGYGIKIYSIGMGRDGQAQLPIFTKDSRGRTRKHYRPMHSKVNEKLLGQMASETGGKYYRATTSNALEEVFQDINNLERTKIETSQYTRYGELYQDYLYWAMIFLILSLLFSNTLLRRFP